MGNIKYLVYFFFPFSIFFGKAVESHNVAVSWDKRVSNGAELKK